MTNKFNCYLGLAMSIHEQTKISNLSNTKENYTYKVSVIVPCYNTKPWLDECLQSLVDQTLQEIEIICVNDGSTDGTGNRLDEWQAQYSDKIKVIHQQNGGLSNARNAGMAIAQGECIGFVDSDDFVDTTMYEKMYQVYKDNNADIVRCKSTSFNRKNILNNYVNISIEIKKINTIEKLIKGNIFLWDCIYKANFLHQNNIKFTNNIHFYEDIIFTYNVATSLPKMYGISNIFYYYRQQRAGQLTSLKNKKLYGVFKAFRHLEKYHYKNNMINWKIDKYITRIKILSFTNCWLKIALKYKKKFLFKAAYAIFNKRSVKDIYKKILLHKYRKPINYLLAPITLILFHCCYLWQKISIKNIKKYFTTI